MEGANGGVTRKITYSAYRSIAQLKEYLGYLIENGLIEFESIERKYRTIAKAIRYPQASSHMGTMMAAIEGK